MLDRIALPLFLLIASASAQAEMLPLTVRELVAKSEIAIVGRVLEAHAPCPTCESGWAEVLVEKPLKGKVKQSAKVKVIYDRLSEAPGFKAGETQVLFLKNWKDGFATVAGYVGAVRLANQKADTGFLKGLGSEVAEDVFVQMVYREAAAQQPKNRDR